MCLFRKVLLQCVIKKHTQLSSKPWKRKSHKRNKNNTHQRNKCFCRTNLQENIHQLWITSRIASISLNKIKWYLWGEERYSSVKHSLALEDNLYNHPRKVSLNSRLTYFALELSFFIIFLHDTLTGQNILKYFYLRIRLPSSETDVSISSREVFITIYFAGFITISSIANLWHHFSSVPNRPR